jgi:hypothetical protein
MNIGTKLYNRLGLGTRVMVDGLQNAKQYNGQFAAVQGYDSARGRYKVQLEADGETIMAKSVNLVLVESVADVTPAELKERTGCCRWEDLGGVRKQMQVRRTERLTQASWPKPLGSNAWLHLFGSTSWLHLGNLRTAENPPHTKALAQPGAPRGPQHERAQRRQNDLPALREALRRAEMAEAAAAAAAEGPAQEAREARERQATVPQPEPEPAPARSASSGAAPAAELANCRPPGEEPSGPAAAAAAATRSAKRRARKRAQKRDGPGPAGAF